LESGRTGEEEEEERFYSPFGGRRGLLDSEFRREGGLQEEEWKWALEGKEGPLTLLRKKHCMTSAACRCAWNRDLARCSRNAAWMTVAACASRMRANCSRALRPRQTDCTRSTHCSALR
jgi:hypothetical protein